MVTKNDCVLMISNSGETKEVLNLLPSLKKIGVKKIALTRNHNSTLAKACDVSLAYSYQREADELAHVNSEIAKSNEYWDNRVQSAINKMRGIPEPTPEPAAPSLYKQQNFEQTKMAEMFGTDSSKWDQKRFQQYLKSEQGQKDWLAFDKAEHQKYMESMDAVVAHRKAQMQNTASNFAANVKPALVSKVAPETPATPPTPPTPPTTPVKPAVTPRSNAEWARIAKENGFADMGEVMAWQEANGLEADGKFGNASSAFFKANGLGKYQKTPGGYVELSRSDGTTFLQKTNSTPTPTNTSETSTPFDLMGYATQNGLNKFYNHGGKRYVRYDPFGIGDFLIGEDGEMYHAGRWGSLGKKVSNSSVGIEGSDHYNNYQKVLGTLNSFKGVTSNKQGGTMNRINYFQQGGAAPQQDMQQQVVALVQAAMQGDQKATETVNKIIEAAKAGDKQAMQIAQMIQQVAQKLQGQATSAKWGSKLNYIRSLKFAKGGKACPECEKGAPIVEKKACGGKKAKKRYFGGLV
jgi:hypothetical protein